MHKEADTKWRRWWARLAAHGPSHVREGRAGCVAPPLLPSSCPQVRKCLQAALPDELSVSLEPAPRKYKVITELPAAGRLRGRGGMRGGLRWSSLEA